MANVGTSNFTNIFGPLVVIQLAIAYKDGCHFKHVPRIELKYISYKKSKQRFSFSSINHINSPKCVNY